MFKRTTAQEHNVQKRLRNFTSEIERICEGKDAKIQFVKYGCLDISSSILTTLYK